MAGLQDPSDTTTIYAQTIQTVSTDTSTTTRRDGNLNNSSRSDDCCVICLDTISEPCTTHPCAHSHFDFLCLLSWLEQRASCPLCQSPVFKVSQTNNEGESVYRVPNAPRKRKEETRNLQDTRPQRTNNGLADSNISRVYRRQRPHRELPRPPVTEADAIGDRRHVYRHLLYSLHVGTNRSSQYRQSPTPAQFTSMPHLVSRARTWIRRELQVFTFLSEDTSNSPSNTTPSEATDRDQMRRRNNAEFLLEYIITILKTVDMQDSAGQAEEMLADFFGKDQARLFLHELRSWLRSPCQSLVAWDREVQYPNVQRKRALEHTNEDHLPITNDRVRGRGRGGYERGDVLSMVPGEIPTPIGRPKQ